MRQINVTGGVTQQWDGPWYGLRVVDAGSGAALSIDDQGTFAVLGSFSFRPDPGRPIEKLRVTGLIILQLAESPDEALEGNMNRSSDGAKVEEFGPLSGVDVQTNPIDVDLRRPEGATQLDVHYWCGALVGALGVTTELWSYESDDVTLWRNFYHRANPSVTAVADPFYRQLLSMGPDRTNFQGLPAGSDVMIFQEVVRPHMRLRFTTTGAGENITNLKLRVIWGRA